MPAARIAAIVVTYQRRAQAEVTVRRLLEEGVDHLVVVDNGSTDGTRDWLAGLGDPRLELLLPETNLGGAGGFEAGLRHAVAHLDPDWCLLMDDDARPEPGTLAAFRACDWNGWDAVSGGAFLPGGEVCEMNRPWINPFWSWRVFWRTFAGGGRMGFHFTDDAYAATAPCRIDGASFVGIFLSRRAIDTNGYPDGDLFIYADDSIYTLELTRAGGRIAFAPELRFEHDCRTFTQQGPKIYSPLWKVYYTYRNGLLLYRRAAGPWFWLVLPLVAAKWARAGRHYGTDRPAFYRLFRRALRDGVMGRTGWHPERE